MEKSKLLNAIASRVKYLADDLKDGTALECLDSDDNAVRLNLALEHLLIVEALLRVAAGSK